jgi:Uma2 family endonuclease
MIDPLTPLNPPSESSGAPFVGKDVEPYYVLPPDVIPNVEDLVIEDGTPVENIFAEKQYRLLTEPLYSSWAEAAGGPFLALANVGLFHTYGEPPLAPDVMLSLKVRTSLDLARKEHRSYFVWVFGKSPDVAIEFVSDRSGGEEDYKKDEYERIGVTYYVIFDPNDRLRGGILRAFALREGSYQPIDLSWLPNVGLGLKLWEGAYEGQAGQWLRWCDRDGVVIPTGHERAEQEHQRAEQEHQRAEQERQRAEQERQRAEQERQRAEQERQRAERLIAQLKSLGVEPEH